MNESLVDTSLSPQDCSLTMLRAGAGERTITLIPIQPEGKVWPGLAAN